jgi:hypothetical protein
MRWLSKQTCGSVDLQGSGRGVNSQVVKSQSRISGHVKLTDCCFED